MFRQQQLKMARQLYVQARAVKDGQDNFMFRQQQLKMAKMMDEIFGDLLNKSFLPNYPMKKGKIQKRKEKHKS